jgi:quercetin dioxygenase-like cupin family protein
MRGGGAGPEYPMSSGSYSFLALAPGVRHRVRNVKEEGKFVFLLTQGPLDGYDFIAA